MNQNQTESKPDDAEQESGKGLDEAACSLSSVRSLRMECQKCGGFWVSPDNAQRLMDERDSLLKREAAIIQFCEVEMGWEFFRAEFKIGDNPSKSLENAMKLRKFLSENSAKHIDRHE